MRKQKNTRPISIRHQAMNTHPGLPGMCVRLLLPRGPARLARSERANIWGCRVQSFPLFPKGSGRSCADVGGASALLRAGPAGLAVRMGRLWTASHPIGAVHSLTS